MREGSSSGPVPGLDANQRPWSVPAISGTGYRARTAATGSLPGTGEEVRQRDTRTQLLAEEPRAEIRAHRLRPHRSDFSWIDQRRLLT